MLLRGAVVHMGLAKPHTPKSLSFAFLKQKVSISGESHGTFSKYNFTLAHYTGIQ